jgi:hypothetical protein
MILATPLFFVGLMAISLAIEEPTVTHLVRHGRAVERLGDPSGGNELAIWVLAFTVPVFMAAVGTAAMLLGRRGVLVPAAAAIAVTIALLAPIGGWKDAHTARYPTGVDLIPPSAGSQDIYVRGEWERSARRTAEQLGIAAIAMAGVAVGMFALLELRRRRGPGPAQPPPPPYVHAPDTTPPGLAGSQL